VNNGILFPILDAPTPGVFSSFVFFNLLIMENKTLGHM
jgi:hypothetical protein